MTTITRRTFLKALGAALAASFAVAPRVASAGVSPSPERAAEISKLFAPKGLPRFIITSANLSYEGGIGSIPSARTIRLDFTAYFERQQCVWMREAWLADEPVEIMSGTEVGIDNFDIGGMWRIVSFRINAGPDSLMTVSYSLIKLPERGRG